MSAKPILINAKRLLDDAKLLAANQRYNSAMALAVLSAEEIGKFYLQKWEAPPSELRSHPAKQRTFGSLLMASILMDGVVSFLERHGYQFKHQSELSESQKDSIQSEEVREFNRRFYSGEIEDVESGEKLLSFMANILQGIPLAEEIMTGKMNEWKKMMFYVDVEGPAFMVEDEKLAADVHTMIGQIQKVLEEANNK